MKNILLIITITFGSLADAQVGEFESADNYLIERVYMSKNNWFNVYCFQSYVFMQTRDGSLVQVMMYPAPRARGNFPMKCREWKKKNRD